MFYSRPQIPPLDWDLATPIEVEGPRGAALPTWYHAIIKGGDELKIRYEYGELRALRGPPGATSPKMKTVLDRQVGPWFAEDFLPEELYDVLGLTLNGYKVEATKLNSRFDWSGKTTYWECMACVTPEGLRNFTKKLKTAFTDVTLLQCNISEGMSFSSYTIEEPEIKNKNLPPNLFLKIGINCIDKEKLGRLVGQNPPDIHFSNPLEDIFKFSFRCNLFWNGKSSITQHSYPDLEFMPQWWGKCNTVHTTQNTFQEECVRKIVSTFDASFFENVDWVDLKTSKAHDKRSIDASRGLAEWRFSNDQKDWCLMQNNRYLLRTADSKVTIGARPEIPSQA